MAENLLQMQPARGPGPVFEKGRSGNPAGKPARVTEPGDSAARTVEAICRPSSSYGRRDR